MGALALHLGGAALAIAHLRGDVPDDSLGAAGIEIGFEMAAPHVDESDLPAGPDKEASDASPELPDQKAVVKETDLPTDKPTETENPDQVVTPDISKKPKEDDPKEAAVESVASPESVKQEATARQNMDNARDSQTAVAPNPGIGKDGQKLTKNWMKRLNAYLQLHLRYPEVKNSKAVTVTLLLVLDRLGHVVSVSVLEGSGDAVYDEAALAMVRRSDPVPVPPPVVADNGLSFTLPVRFTVNGRS
jgi:protein TonB